MIIEVTRPQHRLVEAIAVLAVEDDPIALQARVHPRDDARHPAAVGALGTVSGFSRIQMGSSELVVKDSEVIVILYTNSRWLRGGG